jgi:hypothetical protein
MQLPATRATDFIHNEEERKARESENVAVLYCLGHVDILSNFFLIQGCSVAGPLLIPSHATLIYPNNNKHSIAACLDLKVSKDEPARDP